METWTGKNAKREKKNTLNTLSCSCGAVSSMRLIEEKKEKKQGQVRKKKENPFRKLSWRGEGQWVFILHTLAGLKHFI